MERPIVTPERFEDMPFPIYGTDLLLAPSFQRPLTTATGVNVRAYENLTLRGRGGSRPGLGRFVGQQIPAGSTLIQHLNIVTDPFATALVSTIGSGNGSGQPPAALGPTAVLDTSSPDEIGPRTNGDQWVPLGGWAAQPTRNAPQQKTITAYCISASMKLQCAVGNFGVFGLTHQQMVCNADFLLNGSVFANIVGVATAVVPALGPIAYTDWASTAWYSTNSMVPTTPNGVDGGNTSHLGQITFISGGRGGTPTFVLLVINKSAFNITAQPFTALNTVSIIGQTTVTGDGTDCTTGMGVSSLDNGVLISVKELLTTDGGVSWMHGPSQSYTSYGAGANIPPIAGGSQIYTSAFNVTSGTPTVLL